MNDLSMIDFIYGLLILALGALMQLGSTGLRELRADQKAAEGRHERLAAKVDERDAAITHQISLVHNELVRDYAPRRELTEKLVSIDKGIQRIYEKLDTKADKV